MDSLISKLQKKKPELSTLENQVLEYILANPTEVINLSIEEVAQTLFISTATISRTAKRLGFKGFQELKYAIMHYTNQERRLVNTSVLNKEIIAYRDSLIHQLSISLNQLSETDLNQAVSMIEKANSIEIMGVGGSLPNCIDASKKLTALGKKSAARVDWDDLRAASKSLDSDDLAILISLSGETIHIIEYASNFKENNVPFIAVVGVENSTLEQLATITFQAAVEPVYFGNIDLSSRVALTGVFDLMMIRYAERKRTDL